MGYPYSAENRLKLPANYQYAAFGGQAYLAEYLRDRESALEALGVRPAAASTSVLLDLLGEYATNGEHVPIDVLSIDQTISTQTLLISLAFWLEGDKAYPEGEIWLRRLIQRFEVSKRLYNAYPPGFRKGVGDFSQIDLYLAFAAVLCLRHLETGNLQCLSTLLKTTDLLCSLPASEVEPKAAKLFAVILELEAMAVCKLANTRGLSLAT